MIGNAPFRSFPYDIVVRGCCVLGMFAALLGSSLTAAPQVLSLSSGERLVGEVLPQSNDQVIVFKSSLLGEISIPRAQIVKIEAQVMPAPVAIVTSIAKAEPAPAALQPKKVKKEVATQVTIAEKLSEVEELLQEEQPLVEKLFAFKSPDSWKGTVRMGMNISSGDKQWTETALRGNLEIKEKGSRNFYRLTGSYTYRETEKSNGDKYKSTDRYDATFTYRRSFEQDWFFQNALGWRVDQVKGIDQELQNTVGVGYKLRPIEKFEVLFGGGGGVEDYQTNFSDSRQGVNSVMNVFQELKWHPFTRTSVVQKFNYYWNPEASEQYNYVLSAAVRVRLTDLLGFEFSYSQIYDNDIGNGNPKDDAMWRNALIVYF